MAVTSKEDLMSRIKAKFGDTAEDDILSIYEDMSDTLDSLASKQADGEDWKQKYEENDKMWREKYRDRFFNTDADEEPEPDPQDLTNMGEKPEVKMTYDDLFKESD